MRKACETWATGSVTSLEISKVVEEVVEEGWEAGLLWSVLNREGVAGSDDSEFLTIGLAELFVCMLIGKLG